MGEGKISPWSVDFGGNGVFSTNHPTGCTTLRGGIVRVEEATCRNREEERVPESEMCDGGCDLGLGLGGKLKGLWPSWLKQVLFSSLSSSHRGDGQLRESESSRSK